MKLLLDECLPARLRFDFPGHEVRTLEQGGFKGLKNGVLLRTASVEFDVVITVDQNIPFQQNLAELTMAIVIMVARSNRYSDRLCTKSGLYNDSRLLCDLCVSLRSLR